jgi:biopolymer transport protein ExbD
MIDVVFLLLVFFMLAARFSQDVALPLTTTGASTPYQGPPRLIDIGAGGLRLNGVSLSAADLPDRLQALMSSPSDTVILRPQEGSQMQHLVDVIDDLRAQGLTQLIIVEDAQ